MKKIFNLRRDFTRENLDLNNLMQNPMDLFDEWFKSAMSIELYEPNAFVLGTSTKTGQCSTRYLLLKAYDNEGFIFFTNYKSRKGKNIKENPLGSMVFYWPKTQRQVRIEGGIKVLDKKNSDEYFKVRPEGSKIGAWASPQSSAIPNREYLEELKNKFIKEHVHECIRRPPFWGGYKLKPYLIEFWQGKKDRLHDRFEYRTNGNSWQIERLAP